MYLKKYRKINNLKQSDIAKILNITQEQYHLYETEKRLIPIDKLIILANFYSITLDDLVNRNLPNNLHFVQFFKILHTTKFPYTRLFAIMAIIIYLFSEPFLKSIT